MKNFNGKKFRTCPKCKGTGFLKCYEEIQTGRCFRCNGTGEINTNEYQKFLRLDEIIRLGKEIGSEIERLNCKIEAVHVSRKRNVFRSMELDRVNRAEDKLKELEKEYRGMKR